MKRIIVALLMAAALAAPLVAVPVTASAQVYVGISVGYAPPPLPWYPQPLCPGDDYIWTPGYWAWGPYGYYWVPGTWVFAPAVGMFWTPGYWAWNGGYYWWHGGYWGPTVGYYGGIDYGYGYTGYGYAGGYWRGGDFYYNRTITNVDITYIHNTYSQPVSGPPPSASRISYNGGEGGIRARATAAQLEYARERHVPATAMQLHQERLAFDNPAQRFTVNQGRPQIAATTRPGEFTGSGVVRLNADQNGYVHSGKLTPMPPSYPNADRVNHEPQMPSDNPYANGYRQPARAEMHNLRVPMRPLPARPTPAPAERTRIPQPQPPAMNFGNPYAGAYQSQVRADANNWNMNRNDMARPEQFQRVPIRQASWNVPHVQPRAPSRESNPRGPNHHHGPG